MFPNSPGKWERLTDRERLVIKCIAFELYVGMKKEVEYDNIWRSSGLFLSEIEATTKELELKGLVKLVIKPNKWVARWLTLAGEAATSRLLMPGHPLVS